MKSILCFISIVVASRYILVASGDYICICSNGQRNDICDSMSTNKTIVGHLENNSCAAQANFILDKRTKAWNAIIFYDKIRFVHKGSFTEVRRCIGNPLEQNGTPPTMTDAVTTFAPTLSTTANTITTSVPTMSTTATAVTTSVPTMSTTATAVTTSAPAMSTTATAVTTSAPTMSTSATAVTTSAPTMSTTATAMTTSATTMSKTATEVTTFVTTMSTTATAATSSAPTLSTTATTVTTSAPTLSTTANTITTSTPTMSTTATTVTTSVPTLSTTATTITTSSPTMSTTATAVTKSAPRMSTTATSTHSVNYGCAPTFFLHAASHHGKLFTIGQTCFELVTETRSWSSAESDCKSRGGHLVHIANDEQQNKIYQVVRQYHGDNVWIGLNDRVTEEHFVWSSGHAVSYTHWYPGRKTSLPYEEDCVAMWMTHGGQWEDVRCDGYLSNDYGYVCEFDGVVEVATTSNPDGMMNTDGNTQSCPHITVTTAIVAQFGKSCYALYRDLEIWSHAEQTCRLSGGHLAHINDAQEQQYIDGFMRRHNQMTPAWIGLSDRIAEGHFVWTDGVSTPYTNWLPGNVTHGNAEDCVALLPSNNGTWDDFSCGQTGLLGNERGEQHYPLCEYGNTISSVLVG